MANIVGERGGIRTRDLWLRRPTLYPAELPVHKRINSYTTPLPSFPGLFGVVRRGPGPTFLGREVEPGALSDSAR